MTKNVCNFKIFKYSNSIKLVVFSCFENSTNLNFPSENVSPDSSSATQKNTTKKFLIILNAKQVEFSIKNSFFLIQKRIKNQFKNIRE